MKQAGRALAVLAATLAWPVGLAAQEAHVTHVAGAKFAPFPNIPECVKGAVLQGDPGTGPSIILIRGMAGCHIPRHWHAATETLLFVSGAARLGMKGQPPETLRAGSYGVVPAKHQHRLHRRVQLLHQRRGSLRHPLRGRRRQRDPAREGPPQGEGRTGGDGQEAAVAAAGTTRSVPS